MNRHYFAVITFCFFITSGCATESTRHYQVLNEAVIAEAFTQSGQHKQAANLYQSLASSKPTQRDEFNLLAAEAFIQSGDNSSAQSIISQINPTSLDVEQGSKLNLILAQINLSEGEAEQALNRLNNIQPYNLSLADQVIFYQSMAFAQSLSGKPLKSVKARIKLSALLQSVEQQSENNKVILDTLSLLPPQMLNYQQNTSDNIFNGWIALAKILKDSRLNQSPIEFQLNLTEWQRLYPHHPANTDFILSYSQGLTNTFKSPNSVAILLPESGPYAKATEAIKAGFMAAYHQSALAEQPSIRFYDSAIENIVNLYHLAISEGAELIIGPLSKDNIQELALSTELTTPVLALNHVSNLAKDNLFQFGLSPIDEVKELVNKAKSDGVEKVLILAPESNQGHRMAAYLTDFWQQSDSTVLETQFYNRRASDFTPSIKSLLNLDESNYRYKRLKQTLARNIQFTEQRRKDVDAIFLSASPQKARSIYPQLQFYRATQVPVYALPEIYSGEPNPPADIDLNGIIFCDIPWVFPKLYSGELSKESLRDSWQRLPQKYLRLIALGIDSFNLSSRLADLANAPYQGATGGLSINLENRVTRQLSCAKFINGSPVIQEPKEEGEPFDLQDSPL